MSALADAFMAIFGFKRIATVKGNIIEPVFGRDDDLPGYEDNVWKNCGVCCEQYQLPEDLETCPICGKKDLKGI